MDATRLKDVELFGGKAPAAVVSGLPLLVMPPKKVIAIWKGRSRICVPVGPLPITYGARAAR